MPLLPLTQERGIFFRALLMSVQLNGSKSSPPGTRVPTELLPTAIRYENARAMVFHNFGQHGKAYECEELKRYYERRTIEECV